MSTLTAAEQPRRHGAAADWQNTRFQTSLVTQFMGDEEQYLGGEQPDIGRPVGHDDRELFVSCGAGEALAQQFEHLKADFIAVHDIATRSSQQLVAGIAAAMGRPLRKLIVRRQGFGTVLATLSYAELASADAGPPVRIYATESGPAAPSERHAVARALLAHSRLGVLMVGELPAPTLADQTQRWRAELTQPAAWPNRQLLVLPLSANPALADQAHEMARATPVLVRCTQKVTRAADAWNLVHAAWAQLRGPLAVPPKVAPLHLGSAASPASTTAPSAPSAPAAPAPVRVPMPVPKSTHTAPGAAGATARPRAAAADDAALSRYVEKVAELDGMAGCCVFDTASGRELAHARSDPRWAELARHGNELLVAMTSAAARLGLRNGAQPPQPEAAITLGSHHLLLRPVPHRSGLTLHAVLDTGSGTNLTLLRLRLERLDETMRA